MSGERTACAPAASRLNRTTFRFLAEPETTPRRLPGVRLPARAAALAAVEALPALAAFAADPGRRPVRSRPAMKSQKPASVGLGAFSLPVRRRPVLPLHIEQHGRHMKKWEQRTGKVLTETPQHA